MLRKWLIRIGLIHKSWRDVERYESVWNERIKIMTGLIPSDTSSIMDMGAGTEELKNYLDPQIEYIPVDLKARSKKTKVIDFNKKEFPSIQVDTIFVSGCLEYVQYPEWFVSKVAQQSKYCILSYCILENYPNVKNRKDNAWRNHFNQQEIIGLFQSKNMQLIKHLNTDNNIFLFSV